jgi:hypothetical protein
VVVFESRFLYSFPEGWKAIKFDGTAYYRERFQSFAGGCKAVDIIACAPTGDELWLIECKDFRDQGREKQDDLYVEIAKKVRDTLAALCCSRAGDDHTLREFARLAMRKYVLRCVLHWEHPLKPHRLFPEVPDRKTARDRIRQKLRTADPRADIGTFNQLNTTMPWKITVREDE